MYVYCNKALGAADLDTTGRLKKQYELYERKGFMGSTRGLYVLYTIYMGTMYGTMYIKVICNFTVYKCSICRTECVYAQLYVKWTNTVQLPYWSAGLG